MHIPSYIACQIMVKVIRMLVYLRTPTNTCICCFRRFLTDILNVLVVWPEYTCIMNCGCDAYAYHACVHIYYFQAIKFLMKMLLTACITYKHHDACAFSSINAHHLLHFMCFTYSRGRDKGYISHRLNYVLRNESYRFHVVYT